MMIDKYIDSKRYAWAASTIRSERYRLYGLGIQLYAKPEQLWQHLLDTQKPYSRNTTWTRVVEFHEWLIEQGESNGPNQYKIWRTKNAKVFKNTYTKSLPEITIEEARTRIGLISNERVKEAALQLLKTGMRFHEIGSISNGTITGKGGKTRRVYGSSKNSQVRYQTVYRELRKIGLKPHMLRKIFTSRLVQEGANEFELCEIMGWSNLNTASSYVKVNSNRARELVEKAIA